MYSIKERKRKDGSSSYQIQVKIIDYKGDEIQRAKTWKPEQVYTEKQLVIALKRIAKEFEDEVIEACGGRLKPIATNETKFNEFAEYWLKNIEAKKSASYYASSKVGYDKIKHITEPYKLKDLTPIRLEEIYSQIHALKHTKTYIVAKPILKEILHERYGYQYYRFFCKPNGLNKCVVRDALKQRTSLETATSISNALGISMGEIFDYEIEETAFQSSYYEGMKKIVRCTLQFAVRLGVLDYNFARKLYITTKHRDANKVHSMTVDEAKLLVQECMKNEDIRKKTAIMFLLFTGVRKGELCGLNWSDFNFERNTVSIKRQYETVAYKGLILKEPKTQSSIRTFELPDGIIALLKEYKVWYDNKKYALADKWESDDDCVFVGKAGKRLHPTTIRNWFDELLDNAGVKHYSVHSLRHTNITLLMIAGVPVVTVSNRVGHSKSMTTLNVYADYLGSSDLEASSKINQYFSEKKGIILKAE